jgi:hypothetical protein
MIRFSRLPGMLLLAAAATGAYTGCPEGCNERPVPGECEAPTDCMAGETCSGGGGGSFGRCVTDSHAVPACTAEVLPDDPRVPADLTIRATVTNPGTPPDMISWSVPMVDFGEGEQFQLHVIRPLRATGRFEIQDSAANPKFGTCSFEIDVPAPGLDVGCNVVPASGPAPLQVILSASPQGCVGPCHFAWDFGDGERSEEDRLRVVPHDYGPGEFTARVRLTDSVADRAANCHKRVSVRSPEPSDPGPSNPSVPSPPPTPPAAPSAGLQVE